MGEKRRSRSGATREQLLDAARAVFEVKGYQAATVAAITEAAETAHGTFYLYFRNKEDVFGQVLDSVAHELHRGIDARRPVGDGYASVEASIRGYLEVFVAHRQLWRCLLEGIFQSAAVEARWMGLRRTFTERIARGLASSSEAVRPVDLELASGALASMVEWFAFTHFVLDHPPAGDDALDRSVRQLARLWYHAVHPDVADDRASLAS